MIERRGGGQNLGTRCPAGPLSLPCAEFFLALRFFGTIAGSGEVAMRCEPRRAQACCEMRKVGAGAVQCVLVALAGLVSAQQRGFRSVAIDGREAD